MLTPEELQRTMFHFRQCAIPFTLSSLEVTDGVDEIRAALTRVENAYAQTTLTSGQMIDMENEQTLQNITVTSGNYTTTYGDRTRTKRRLPSWRERVSHYHSQVEALARAVGVIV